MNKQKHFVQEYIPLLKRKAFYRENYVIDINYKKYEEFKGGYKSNDTYAKYNIILLSNILYASISNAGIVTLILRKFLERNKYDLDIIKKYTSYITKPSNLCCLYNFINADVDNADLDNADNTGSVDNADNTGSVDNADNTGSVDNADDTGSVDNADNTGSVDNADDINNVYGIADNIDVAEYEEQKNMEELNNILYVDIHNIKAIMDEEINNKYNIVYLIGVLHHVDKKDLLLSKLKKCLDIDGRIIIKELDIDNNVLLAHQICGCSVLPFTKQDLIDTIDKLNLYKTKIYDENIIFTIELNIK